MTVSLLLWFALYRLLPPLEGMDDFGARMLVALKCLAFATLFTLVAGVEAVAHERLQSAAFDPLAGHETRRLRVNLRFLQNTLEQLVIFAVGLFGLAAYMTSGEAMRAVVATSVVWILNRYAFWIGYHRSAAMRGLGAPSMAIGLIMLLYVVARIGEDAAGTAGTAVAVGLFLAVEAVLFWKTR
ncbi:MAPEG family protein [Sphingomonas segetis]|jgi:hypothetical protein|uniref:MAPEG family protein n=1 Tax=Sphingomonas segetis TaxID=1104779 RepID=UPI0012D2EA51|nr:MAPEG family protein [Sphingomonas segetis]